MDTSALHRSSNTAPPLSEAAQQQLHANLLNEFEQRIDAVQQRLSLQMQQLFQQHAVAPVAPPVAIAAAPAVPLHATAPGTWSERAPAAKMSAPEHFSGARGQNVYPLLIHVTVT